MSEKVIHIQTTMQMVLGVVDEHGNVVRKVPLNVEVGKLDRDAFVEAYVQLKDARDRVASEFKSE